MILAFKGTNSLYQESIGELVSSKSILHALALEKYVWKCCAVQDTLKYEQDCRYRHVLKEKWSNEPEAALQNRRILSSKSAFERNN